MKTDKTIEVSAVVTPNCAIANRNHMSSQRTLQNPETKKNQKNHPILFRPPGLDGSKTQSNTALYTLGNVGPLMPGALSIKYPFGVLPMKIVHENRSQHRGAACVTLSRRPCRRLPTIPTTSSLNWKPPKAASTPILLASSANSSRRSQ